MKQERNFYPDLYRQIARVFNMEDLRQLTYILSVQFDDLHGQTNTMKALSLVDYLEDRGKIGELVTTLYEERPHIEWADLVQPQKQKVIPKKLREEVKQPEFQKAAKQIAKECHEMSEDLEDKAEPTTATKLSVCLENWESLLRDLSLIRHDLSSTLITDIRTIKEGQSFMQLAASFCQTLQQTLNNENINPTSLRPDSHVCDDLQTIQWHTHQTIQSLDSLEGHMYADEEFDDDAYIVREEFSIVEYMVTDITDWLTAVIQLLDEPKDTQQTETAENS